MTREHPQAEQRHDSRGNSTVKIEVPSKYSVLT
jgi:hypothetical protein